MALPIKVFPVESAVGRYQFTAMNEVIDAATALHFISEHYIEKKSTS